MICKLTLIRQKNETEKGEINAKFELSANHQYKAGIYYDANEYI